MNSTYIFTDRAKEYAQYRSSYPTEAIAAIVEGLMSSSQLVAADIGAGTGIASRLLGNCGVKVMAVEPNSAMRQEAEYHSQVEFKAGTAEKTNLPDDSVDLVTSFSAFHWFNPLPTLQEFHRILKPHGRLALIWNMWDETDTFTQELNNLVDIASESTPTHQNWQSKVGIPPENPYFQSFDRLQFSYSEQQNLPELIGLVESQGFIPLAGIKHQKITRYLQNLHQKWADNQSKVSLVYRTDVYLSQAEKL
ncbi:MAG: class I SAM-dependent methyltransferase [Xenococcaceae cyanobacterium MO_188.B29]|nr:class I SAM-dependent methyltransferase [Xenococcaceae cyanobacterium MO_188.B29]